MKIRIFTIVSLLCAFVCGAQAQQIDTTGIYGDRTDSLGAAVFTQRQPGKVLSKYTPNRVETITAAGLCKMACCNLAESFENSASVTVGYSDAVTGARQIKLLGLSGIYTQMLDENRPVMRGLSAPFGLGYVPGQWLESIQIAKGATSVINGVESITGQINMEHRKPTDEVPLFINASLMSDTKTDFNIASSLQLNESWSTVLLGHVSGNFMGMDDNKDGFLDDPLTLQYNLSNRWLYYAPSGVQVRFGVRAIHDTRRGGEATHTEDMKLKMRRTSEYDYDVYLSSAGTAPWGSRISNSSIDGYLKVGVPLNEDNSQNIAMVLDYNYQDMNSYFGATKFLADQHSGFANLLYQNELSESHKFTVGASAMMDFYNMGLDRRLKQTLPPFNYETLSAINGWKNFYTVGAFGEYTYHFEEKFSLIAGLRLDANLASLSGKGLSTKKFVPSPRLTLKYMPDKSVVIRANVGRGARTSMPLIDNIGVFSTSKKFTGDYAGGLLEDAWTVGGNITYYIPLEGSYISFDYFRSQFVDQMIVDYEHGFGEIDFYSLRSLPKGCRRSFTDSYQLDFSIEPVERFNITLTARYTNAKTNLKDKTGLVERPLTSRYKGVLNLQYATRLNKWIFDFTASVNGPCRVYEFMKDNRQIKEKNGNYYSTVYPLLYAQITKRFKGVDIYVGAENMTNFRQKDLISGSKSGEKYLTNQSDFDASCVWGPIMGAKVYAGVRFTLWKTE